MDRILHLGFFSGTPGPSELVLVFLVVLLLFGPRKLPGIARSIGHLLHQLRRASDDFRDQLMRVDEDVRTEVHEAIDQPPAHDDDPSSAVTGAEVSDVPDDDSEEDKPLAG